MLRKMKLWAAAAAVTLTTAFSGSAMAQTDPTTGESVYVLDLGIVPTDVTDGLSAVLVPFLIAAITIGFAFYAVKLGVRWIKGMARG